MIFLLSPPLLFFSLLLLSSACPEAFPSARRQTASILSFTRSQCLSMMAHVLTALSTPFTRRWPVLRSSPPCRLSPRCITWSTTRPHPPPLPLPRPPRPPPPAWTLLWAAWMSRTQSLCLACPPVKAVPAALIRLETPCLCLKPFVSSHPSPSFKPLDSFFLSCTRPWRRTHPHPCLWKATSIIFCMRCPCRPPAGLWSSMGCRDPLCASGLGQGSSHWGSILLEMPSLCWVWTTWWKHSPVLFWRHKSCFTLKVSMLFLCWKWY